MDIVYILGASSAVIILSLKEASVYQSQECIYNIEIMEERQSIIAFGAGAVSKIYYPEENRLERVPNVKNVTEYLSRIDEMIERKRKELRHE